MIILEVTSYNFNGADQAAAFVFRIGSVSHILTLLSSGTGIVILNSVAIEIAGIELYSKVGEYEEYGLLNCNDVSEKTRRFRRSYLSVFRVEA
jgi:hypothetical protein